MKDIVKNLIQIYSNFFNNVGGIDEKGIFNQNSSIRFQTYPFIGSKYGHAKKILFIGLDVGAEEKLGIQTFEERNRAIELKELRFHNPHIAGTYICALYFLKEDLNLSSIWEKIKNLKSSQFALKNISLDKNLLSYIGLTNFYKFVKIGREIRTGAADRIYRNKEKENELLLAEIEIFNPDLVIFQGKQFALKKYFKLFSRIKSKIIIGPHPSYRGKREPEQFIKQFVEITK